MSDSDQAKKTNGANHKVVVKGLSKDFEQRGKPLRVLDNVDLTVDDGEFVMLLGPSGCGKSTLLNIIAGFEKPSEGEVKIDGVTVDGPNKKRVFVFQEYGIFPWGTVWDNVALGIRDLPTKERDAIVEKTIEMVGLGGFQGSYPRELSGGMKQRVEVARALAVNPDVIYMDEPFGALDSLTRISMRSELVRIWQTQRTTIMFVTHDVDESIQLAQRVVVLSARPGRIAEIVDVPMEYPREIGSPEYVRIKKRLYELLGVGVTVASR